jgi:hypothetical protein
MQRSLRLLLTILMLALGGCGGEEVTRRNNLPVHCLDEPQLGVCKARVIGYFYDYRNNRCRPFRYGTCEGHVPFETLDTCEQTCVDSG